MVIFAAFIVFALIVAFAWIVDLLCIGIVTLIPALANSHGFVVAIALGIFFITAIVVACVIENRRGVVFDDSYE